MDPILFLAREFLHKMSGSEIGAEEREAYRESLAVYCDSEEGRVTPRLLIASFNRLAREEYRWFPPETMLWFLDWIASLEDEELVRSLESAIFQNIWLEFDEAPVRLRALEVALQREAGRTPPQQSIMRDIYETAGADRELVLDALRSDGSDYASAVMSVIGIA
jgi:hypothetical protein